MPRQPHQSRHHSHHSHHSHHPHHPQDHIAVQLTSAELLHKVQEPFLKRFAAELEQCERFHNESNERIKVLVGMQMEILGQVISRHHIDHHTDHHHAEVHHHQPCRESHSSTSDRHSSTGVSGISLHRQESPVTAQLHPGSPMMPRGSIEQVDLDSSMDQAAGALKQLDMEVAKHMKLALPPKTAFNAVVPEPMDAPPALMNAADLPGSAENEILSDAGVKSEDQASVVAVAPNSIDVAGMDSELELSPDRDRDRETEAVSTSNAVLNSSNTLGTQADEQERRASRLPSGEICGTHTLPIPRLGDTAPDDDHDEDAPPRSSNVSQVPSLPKSQPKNIYNNRQKTSQSSEQLSSEYRGSDLLTFDTLPVWKKKRKSTLNRLFKNSWQNENFDAKEFTRGLSFRMSDPDAFKDLHNSRFRWFFLKYLLILPSSKLRMFWDTLGLVLVTYDTIYIPLLLLDPPESTAGTVMDWITRTFWSTDLPLSFLTGYIRSDGGTETHFPKIAKRYCKTWLLPDIVVVGSDWLELMMTGIGTGLEYARLGKASRVFRVLRLIRLMRLIKMGQVIRLMQERLFSEIWVIGSEIVKRMVIILSFEHLCACIWYGIGDREVDEKTWVKEMPGDFPKEPLGARYFASLHWSLSQLGGGMDEIAPRNYEERITAILVYLVSFVIAAIFVSGLTSAMTRLVILGSQQSQQLSGLRRYLLLNGISNGLMLRIQRNANYALSERQKFMPEGRVELLDVISEPLRVELHFEIYSSVLSVHHFFQRYIEECPPVMRKVCHAGISTTEVSQGDVLFTVGEIPTRPKMYFQRSGELQYVAITGKVTQLSGQMWLSEAVMWCQWMHRGQLTSATDARMVMLDAKTFQDIASEFDHHDFDPKVYAAEFVQHLNKCASEEISDLPWGAGDDDDFESLKRASVLSWSEKNSSKMNKMSSLMGKTSSREGKSGDSKTKKQTR